jgi:hypothetical protein
MKELLNVKRNRVILILLGIFILIISYYGIYITNQDKIDSLELEMVDMKSHLAKLEEFNGKKQFYLDETDRMNSEIDIIKSKFPADILPEDLIMYIKEVEDDYDTNITNAVFSEKMTLNDLEMASVEDAASSTNETSSASTTASTSEASTTNDSNSGNPEGYKRMIYLTVQSSYIGLKDLITHIINGNDKMVIESVSSNYDVNTGKISSEVTINCYYMTGTGREYEGSTIPKETMGKANIFNTQR